MIKLVIGSVVGGIAQWIVGFLFWGTPLSAIPYKVVPEAQNAAVQTALAQNLTGSGTGTYYIPWPDTPQGTILHGRGPVAMIHFNTSGFPVDDTGSIIGMLILCIVTTFLIGLALWIIADRVTDFASRAKIVVLSAVAGTLFFVLSTPVSNAMMPWGYWIYTAIESLIGMTAGGLVVARWFLPKGSVAPGTVH